MADSKEGGSNSQNEEGEEECGFCIFMKGGGCKESFTNWSDCVDQHREGSKDFTEECKDATLALQDCMMENKDYYKDFIGLADNVEGDASKDQGKSGSESKSGNDDKKEDSQGDKADSSNNEKPADGNSQSEGKGSEDESKEGGSDSSKSSRLENTPAEKHDEASKDSESKQARTHEQETNPVKAKPDPAKKEEAAKQPPKPEREENKQEASKQEDSSNDDAGKEDEEAEEAEEKEDDKPHIEIGTAPYDRRFVTTNQARHCYTRYQEFHRCAGEKGEDDKDCSFFRKAYRAICPGDWVDNWNEQREAGTFPGRY